MYRHCLFTILSFLAAEKGVAQSPQVNLSEKKIYLSKISLPRQPLSTSLIEFATQAKILIVADYSLIENLRSGKLYGRYTIEDAITALLLDTDLSYHYDNTERTLRIFKNTNNKVGTSVAETMPAIEEIIVTANQYPFRYSTLTHSQVHGNLSRFDASRILSVLPRALIDDQKPTELRDLLFNTSSITPADGLADSNDDFFVRGFARNALYLNGFRLDPNIGSKIGLGIVESAEIVKGPATLTFGQGEPGGIVNVITKHKRPRTLQKVDLSIGSNHYTSGTLNVAWPIKESPSAPLFSLIAATDSVDSHRDLRSLSRNLYYPSVHIPIGDKQSFSISYLDQTSEQSHSQGTIILTPDGQSLNLVAVGIKPKLFRPSFVSNLDILQMSYTHELSRTWGFRADYSSLKEKRLGVRGSHSVISSTPSFINKEDIEPETNFTTIYEDQQVTLDAGTLINQQDSQVFSVARLSSLFDEQGRSNNYFLSSSIEGSLTTGSFEHHLTLGADHYNQSTRESVYLEERKDIKFITLSQDGTTNALDVVDIVVEEDNLESTITKSSQDLYYTDSSFYFRDNIDINDYWLVSLGSRYSTSKGRLTDYSRNQDINLSGFSISSELLGVTYRPSSNTSFFASYSEGMQPNYIVDDLMSNITSPELSKQIEIGAKLLTMNGKLLATTALYSIEKTNIATIEFKSAIREITFDTEQESKGIDFDFTYQAHRNFNLIGALSVIKPNITQGNHKGLEPPLVASITTRLFGQYNFAQSGISVNAGSHFVGDRYGDKENSIVLNGFNIIDLGIGYNFTYYNSKYKLNLSIKNLLDQNYITATEFGIRASKGSERSATFHLQTQL